MNTRMQEGWTKDDLNGVIDRLENIRKGMSISSYRSKQVEEIFGIVQKDRDIVNSDAKIQKAMLGEEIFSVDDETGIVRFLYPMKSSTECNHCHINASENSINGVLDISFPHSDIKVSLDTVSFYLILFFILFILLIAYIFFFIINKKMVKPVVELTNNIKQIEESKDLASRVDIHTNIEELGILQNSFNQLLITIKYYYDELIKKLYTDELTSVNNLIKLQQDIEKIDEKCYLFILDIKSFGMINRVYGNKVADFLLQEFAINIEKLLKGNGELYRLYGDEFAILYKSKITESEILDYVTKLRSYIYKYNDSEFILDVTIGYTHSSDKNILEQATIALKAAKQHNKLIYQYDDSLAIKDEDSNHILWLNKLDKAIENNNIIPYFMPMKNTKTGKIDKYETLVRIIENDNIYTPDKFIDISIASGKYPIITQTIIKKAFEYFNDIDDIKFSINFSLSDITNEETTDLLFKYLDEYKYSQNVVIELLETEEISDFELLNKFINKVKKYGAKIAIDDFGSGYSNFNYILNLDIDIVKLDRCLIENLYTNQNSVVVVSNIIKAIKELDLTVVAEMVTSQEIESILTIHEVDYLQGFHIGKPQKDILI
ncbi:MAG: EAL domain-containing protein [Campylobacterota bacterium]|nr:EAL domain-containing protein [Campylobacterota bacterium]